jgi:hypothetical protein
MTIRWGMRALSSLAVAALLAGAVTWLTLRPYGGIANGPWRTNLSVGSPSADPWLRARIAVTGLWALNASEVVYLTAFNDDEGRPLSAQCAYRIEGRDPDTRWWSVAAYRDGHFIDNALDRYSFSKTTVARERDGTWRIHVSRREAPGNWLPLGDGPGDVSLSLRCYGPSPALVAAADTVPLPRIVREACE